MLNSLRIRLTLLFVILTVAPLVAAVLLISRQGFDTLQNQTVEFERQLGQRTATTLAAFFHERENELLTLTDVYGLGSLDTNAQRDILLALLSAQPAYYQVSTVDAEGQETIHITRGEVVTAADLTDRSEDSAFKGAMETRSVYFSPVYFNEEARDRLITAGVPMENLLTGEIESVLLAELRFQPIQEQTLRSLNLGAGEEVYVLDTDGIVIAHRNPSLVLRETRFDVPETAGRHTGLSGSDVILASVPLQIGNLTLNVAAETTYANATLVATQSSRTALLIAGITLIIALIIVIVAVDRVVRPIVRMAQVAKSVQAGDLSKRIDLKRKDEVGQLASAFNDMTAAVQKREQDLIKQADELRVATAKAREAARVKSEFLANVSHELRTPLNAIIGFSDMLIAGMSGELNEKQMHKMERLKENGKRLLTLINDLLDLTRIESGRLEVLQKAFAPRALTHRIASQMESLALQSGLKFETNIAPSVPETIVGDEQRVEQVVTNLLSNAFKFTKEGSVSVNVTANQADKTWSIDVVDTGIGIPPHATNVIFEEFRQLDGSYSRAYQGSGLGLAITRNLVRMMGGKISVKSVVDSGSTFTVVLPMDPTETVPEVPVLQPVSA